MLIFARPYRYAALLFRTFTCLVLLLHLSGLQAQHNNHWFFGEYAGLNFNGGVPNPVEGGKVYTPEGCSAVSDDNGQLLFYTDGVTIWDRNHNRMPNGSGLQGQPSSTMAALIVPQPGNPYRYYVFTTASFEFSNQGIQYVVVDMRENNGLGDVVTTSVKIADRGSEKLAAIPNFSGNTYWIVGHRASTDDKSDSFMVWSLQDTGLHHQPRFIQVGSKHTHFFDMLGYLVPSPDGRLLAEAMVGKIQVMKFDREHGNMKVYCTINTGTNQNYGIAFSPNGTRLYASVHGTGIRQYNLNAVNPAAIQSSERIISPPAANNLGSLLLGPDGRLYATEYGARYLNVVENPNLSGPQCGFRRAAVSLNKNSVWLGLPAFPVQRPTFVHRICHDGTAIINTYNISADSVKWEVTDSANPVPVLFRIAGNGFQYRFHAPGTYRVRAVFYGFLGKDTASAYIRIAVTDFPLFPRRDTLICPGDSLLLGTQEDFDAYRWPDASTGKTFQARQPGMYRLQTESNGCVYHDSIRVGYRNPPVVHADTNLCAGDFFAAPLPGMQFYRRFADTLSEPLQRITERGTHYYSLSYGFCTHTDSISVNFKNRPVPSLGRDTILCHPQVFYLSPGAGFDSVRWSDGSRDVRLEVDRTGFYSVEVFQDGCSGSDTIFVTRSFIPNPVLPDSMEMCAGTILTLDAGPDAVWRDAPLPPRRQVSQPGLYRVRIANACGAIDDSVQVYGVDCACYLQFPNSFTPNGDGLNDVFKAESQGCTFDRYQLRVYNRWGQQVFESIDIEHAWDGFYMGKALPDGVYVYSAVGIDSWRKRHVLNGNVTLLR
jgi:gliding motility-associated-like protein